MVVTEFRWTLVKRHLPRKQKDKGTNFTRANKH